MNMQLLPSNSSKSTEMWVEKNIVFVMAHLHNNNVANAHEKEQTPP